MDRREPQALAEACAAAMWAEDRASQGQGMRLERVGPGTAAMSMVVQEHMTNGHGLCHGGFIFALADSTFAFACNSYDQRAVAQHCSITFLRSARLGERLLAEAVEVHRGGRSGLYDVTVRTEDGGVVAAFRGHSRTIKGTLLGEGGVR
jgi:acyl-CoA thioesterase